VSQPLTGLQVYGFGCVGGVFTAVLIYVLPALLDAHATGRWTLTRTNVFVILGLIVVTAGISGAGPLLIGHVTTTGSAIKAGIAGQGTVKGFAEGAKQATKPKRRGREDPSVDLDEDDDYQATAVV
jgi:hypothetical protein